MLKRSLCMNDQDANAVDEVLDLLNGPSLQKFLERVEPAVVQNWDKVDGVSDRSRAGSIGVAARGASELVAPAQRSSSETCVSPKLAHAVRQAAAISVSQPMPLALAPQVFTQSELAVRQCGGFHRALP